MRPILFFFLYFLSHNLYALTNQGECIGWYGAGNFNNDPSGCLNDYKRFDAGAYYRQHPTDARELTIMLGNGSDSGNKYYLSSLCPAGETRSAPDYNCTVPPQPCTAGEVKTIEVRTALHAAAGGTTLFPFSGTGSQKSSGCEFTYDPNAAKLCYRSLPAANGDWAEFCEVAGTLTGAKKSSTYEMPDKDSHPATDTVACGTAPGVSACYDTGDCYKVNGIDVCGVTDTGATINGVDFATGSQKNCGTVNGAYACVEPLPGNGINFGTDTGGALGISSNVKSNTTETSTTNGDGSVTTTRTTTTNVYGQTDVVTTTTVFPDGHTETNTTGGGEGGLSDENPGSLDFGNAPALPGITPFYIQKYPDGLAGVWNTKKTQLTNNPLSGLVTTLTSGAPSSGIEPDFGLDFNIMNGANYGHQSFGFDSNIWGFVRIILLVTTAFTCRRIIFGG